NSGGTVMSRKTILEQTINVAILAVCILTVYTFITHSVPFSQWRDESRFKGLALSSPPGYIWASHPETLVLALREGCPFCEASYPFYRKLNELETHNGLRAHLLAVMPNDKTSGASELKSAGLTIDGVFDQPLNSIKVTGTPTLLLVNAQGRVTQAWVGQLPSSREKDVIIAAKK
ncbi:MAG: peroxiredoxin family protein, partial [Edaphobacter sp.]